MKKSMHLILKSSTGALVTVAISTAPDGGYHRESMCKQTKPAHIPHNMLREVMVQIARWHQRDTPIPQTSAYIAAAAASATALQCSAMRVPISTTA